MTTLSAGFDAELQKDVATTFTAVEIVLPGATLRLLLDASDEVVFSGHTYTGQDDVYGVLSGVDRVSDGVAAEVPRVTLSIETPDETASAVLCAVTGQGSPVAIWEGAIDVTTGAVIPDPDSWFVGTIDVATLHVGDGGVRTVVFEVACDQEVFFEEDEGVLLTDAFHQSVWPGELGLQFVTEVLLQLPWGSDAPRPTVIRDVSGGAGFPDLSQVFPF